MGVLKHPLHPQFRPPGMNGTKTEITRKDLVIYQLRQLDQIYAMTRDCNFFRTNNIFRTLLSRYFACDFETCQHIIFYRDKCQTLILKKKLKKGGKNRHFCNGRSPFQRPHSKLKMKKFYNESNCYGIFFHWRQTTA